jgi:hypothetical protein
LDPGTHIYLSPQELENVEKEMKLIYPIQRGRAKNSKEGETSLPLNDEPLKETNISMLESFAIELVTFFFGKHSTSSSIIHILRFLCQQ